MALKVVLAFEKVIVFAATYGTSISDIEPEFMRIMKIRPDEAQIFRGPTTRPNNVYSDHEYAEESNETDAIWQLVGKELKQYTAPAEIPSFLLFSVPSSLPSSAQLMVESSTLHDGQNEFKD